MVSGHRIAQIPFINRNLNPSIETDTTGYAAVGSTMSQDAVEFYKGVKSLKIITDNAAPLEGFKRTVTAETEANKEYTFSVYLKGSGTVILRFSDNDVGHQNGVQITLSGTWTRYSLTKTFGAASTARELQVVADVQQAITYYADALQHELSATASAYTENKISEVVEIGPYEFISLILPVLDNGNITFIVSTREDGTYVALKKVDGNDVTITAGTGDIAVRDVEELRGHIWMKIVSAVQQTADRNITVIWKER